MDGDRVLVGTFLKKDFVPSSILKSIVETFNTDKIFIFSVEDDVHKRLITFNVSKQDLQEKFGEYKERNRNTVRLHRHKDSNTFYTINSLNKVVETQCGKKDQSHKVDWDSYRNSCLLLDKEGNLKSLKTRIETVVNYGNKQ